jgi:hypothetical protein
MISLITDLLFEAVTLYENVFEKNPPQILNIIY